MGRCLTCHNDYDKSFEVIIDSKSYTFDCFECAIHRLAPLCAHCGCRIIGHGVESGEVYFCSAHCAHKEGVIDARDRVP
jgi:hypothetical protein